MKIALLGYGKMGKQVEALAQHEGWEIGPRLDIDDNMSGAGITNESMAGVDVAIDFSTRDAVLPNIEATARAGVNLVVGTTGWFDALERVRGIVQERGIGLVYASNFSLGMNLFFEIVARACQAVAKSSKYDPFIEEAHHRMKLDAPSGTALTLRGIVEPYWQRTELQVSSTRAGHIPGNHAVGFDSEADTIVLEHRARNRQGFAEGAILAAKWIKGKSGLYEFRNVFSEALDGASAD